MTGFANRCRQIGRNAFPLSAACAVLLLAVAPAMGQSLGWSAYTYYAKRTDGTVTATITLSAASTSVVTVQWATRTPIGPGAATAGEDYVSGMGTAVFPPGSLSQQVQVAIVPNTETQTETFWIDLSNPQNATLSAFSSAEVSLQDPSAAASVAFDSSSWTYNEKDGIAYISVTMTGTPSAPVSVAYNTSDGAGASGAKAGVNYGPTAGMLTWQPSEAGLSKSFSVVLINDLTVTPTLYLNLTLSNPVNATLASPSTATLNIMDSGSSCSVR